MIIISFFSMFLIMVGLPLFFGLLTIVAPIVIGLVSLVLQSIMAIIIFIYTLTIGIVEKIKDKRRKK